MTRALPLWVGSSPDAAVPSRVRLRIFEREGGKCWLSGRKIMPGDLWDLDHRVALINGGTHSEDNLAPALKDKHRAKTGDDVAIKSKTYRMAAKNNGTWPKTRRPLQSRGFDKPRGMGEGG